ncbi:hypothetical protein C8R43DRAFT_1135695 [Mycena crocata]|nr:hypothetical protein C8R43DRAFT_1135695 [Mycena crocata]
MESPFADILYTNTVPSDSECDDIRDLLEAPLKVLTEARKEVTRLQALVEVATKRRDKLQEFIDAHLALVSPARRLPEDIIRGVFMAALPSTRNAALVPDEAPLLLCQICASWRQIALTTPRLWASMHIVVPTQKQMHQLTKMVNTWFTRSGTVPLAITMVSSRTGDPTGDLSPLTSILGAASRRWKDIRLDVYSDYFMPFLASLSPEDVPSLQTLFLGLSVRASYTESDPPKLQILATQSLQSVTISGSEYYLQSPVAWGLLKNLTITWYGGGSPSYKTLLSILERCKLLETCEVFVTGPCEPTTSFSLPHLLHLSISGDGAFPVNAPELFGKLHLPALRSFHSGMIESPRDLTECLIPSTATLECLSVSIRQLRSTLLLAALGSMPFLQELRISQDPVDETTSRRPDLHFLDHLIPSLENCLCPHLRRVELSRFLASDDTLLAFVQGRTGRQLPNGVARLSHFVCTLFRPMQRAIEPDLQDAIANGLTLDLQYRAERLGSKYSPLEGTERPSS